MQKYVTSLRVINDELYCCTKYTIEIYSKDLQLQGSISSTSIGCFYDVAGKDENHVFVSSERGLFVFKKSGRFRGVPWGGGGLGDKSRPL